MPFPVTVVPCLVYMGIASVYHHSFARSAKDLPISKRFSQEVNVDLGLKQSWHIPYYTGMISAQFCADKLVVSGVQQY